MSPEAKKLLDSLFQKHEISERNLSVIREFTAAIAAKAVREVCANTNPTMDVGIYISIGATRVLAKINAEIGNSEWISCSERLPEENGEYEILVNGEPLDDGDEELSPCYYDTQEGWMFDFYSRPTYVVTHWKPATED